MLVEDEPFIALDLETIIAGLGHDVVGVADCLTAALVLAEASKAEAAFIDVNLRTASPVWISPARCATALASASASSQAIPNNCRSIAAAPWA
jgi:DNA-binding NarL/FixJ family response regulator